MPPCLPCRCVVPLSPSGKAKLVERRDTVAAAAVVAEGARGEDEDQEEQRGRDGEEEEDGERGRHHGRLHGDRQEPRAGARLAALVVPRDAGGRDAPVVVLIGLFSSRSGSPRASSGSGTAPTPAAGVDEAIWIRMRRPTAGVLGVARALGSAGCRGPGVEWNRWRIGRRGATGTMATVPMAVPCLAPGRRPTHCTGHGPCRGPDGHIYMHAPRKMARLGERRRREKAMARRGRCPC